MSLNKKGKKIMKAMKKQYGAEEGEAVFYASKNKGVIDDVERKALGGSVKSKKEKLAAIAEPFDEVTQRDVITARKEKLKFKDGKEVKFEDKSDLEKAMITGRPIYLKQDGSPRGEDDQDRRTADKADKAYRDAYFGRLENRTIRDRIEDYYGVGMFQRAKTAPIEARQAGKKAKEKVLKKATGARKQGEIQEQYSSKGKRDNEPVGKFGMGGAVKAAILIMDSGPQPEKAQVKGTKFSGTF